MKLDNLRYTKSDSTKAIAPVKVGKEGLEEPSAIGGMGAIENNYSKGEPQLDTKIIFIISGGSEREKNYFKPLKTDHRIRRVKVAFRSKKGQGLKPYELLAMATEVTKCRTFITEDNATYHFENGDLIYLIQDVDEFGPELQQHLNSEYDRSSISWIISNPSFEIWLFYHYHHDPSILIDGKEMSEHDKSNWLKEYLHKIIPGGIKPAQAFHRADIAIRNSRMNYTENDGLPSTYSTQMHILAENIIKALGKDEYNAMNKRREERIARFKALNSDNI